MTILILLKQQRISAALTGTDAGFPVTDNKAMLVTLATTFGTGAQNSPFAVLADEDGKECVIASYKLLPVISITDSLFVETLPAELIKKSGLTLISQAVRAYAAPGANAYTQGLLAEVTDIVLKNLEAGIRLPRCYRNSVQCRLYRRFCCRQCC